MTKDLNPTANHYVTNKVLIPLLLRDQGTGVLSTELAEKLRQIAIRYARSPSFRGYSYKDEMIAEAILALCVAWTKIDLQRPSLNPFSYFTTVCYHRFLRVIKNERYQRDLKDKLAIECEHSPSWSYRDRSEQQDFT